MYGVFGGDKLAYYLHNPSESFFEDEKRHSMRTVKNALDAY